jgi:thioredoxin 1
MKQLLYFTAVWCGPCQMMAPTISELSQKYYITKIDVDQNLETARQYGIRNVPTFVLTENGVETRRIVGAQSRITLENLFN